MPPTTTVASRFDKCTTPTPESIGVLRPADSPVVRPSTTPTRSWHSAVLDHALSRSPTSDIALTITRTTSSTTTYPTSSCDLATDLARVPESDYALGYPTRTESLGNTIPDRARCPKSDLGSRGLHDTTQYRHHPRFPGARIVPMHHTSSPQDIERPSTSPPDENVTTLLTTMPFVRATREPRAPTRVATVPSHRSIQRRHPRHAQKARPYKRGTSLNIPQQSPTGPRKRGSILAGNRDKHAHVERRHQHAVKPRGARPTRDPDTSIATRARPTRERRPAPRTTSPTTHVPQTSNHTYDYNADLGDGVKGSFGTNESREGRMSRSRDATPRKRFPIRTVTHIGELAASSQCQQDCLGAGTYASS
ncbi:hypothetical protein EDB83DRAFT_2531532 [Lactarius deliciosus]|nr:hypothetical protein EDB83DRAFT_2531532 [Lactarius deliciosus]